MADNVKILNVRADVGQATQKLGELEAKLVKLRKRKAELNKQAKTSTGLTKAEKRELGQLSTQIKTTAIQTRQYSKSILVANGAMKKTSGFVMGIRKALTGMAAQFLGVMAAFALIKNVVGIFADFEQANADLAAVLGKTTDEIKELTEDAKRLGAVTAFTATEVSQLQKEYAKLGFSTDEILDATEATLNLAAATNTDLARAAEVAGSTVRAFGLDASETQRVTDVMAKSFSSSALDMEKFATSMRAVAPVAKNAGLNIEQTTSMLGVLVDRGVDASTAGTSLRNVFLELSKKGLTFQEAMLKINASTDKNATSLELFGKRGAVTGTILAETAEDAANLEQKLNDAGGAAERMAKTQLETLKGKTTLLSSAWEGFVHSILEGDGAMASFLKRSVDGMTNLLNVATDLSKTEEEIFEREGGEEAKKTLKILDQKKDKQEKYNLALQIQESTTVALLENEKLLAEEEKARLAFIKDWGTENEKIKENVDLLKVLIARDREIIKGTEEILKQKEFEAQLDVARKLNLQALTALAGQENEAAKIALAERVKAAEIEAAQQEERSKVDEKELEKRRKQREKAAEELAALNAQLIHDIDQLEIEAIANKQEREKAQAIFDFENKINKITTEGELENQLKTSLKDQLEIDLLAIDQKYEEIENKEKERKAKEQEEADEKERKRILKREEELYKQKQAIAMGFANDIGTILGETIGGAEDAVDNFGKNVALAGLKSLENIVNLAIAEATARSMASAESVASFGIAGVAKSALLAGLIKAAFTAARTAISTKMEDGGVLRGKSHARGGIPTIDGQYEFEGGEAVINKRSTARYGALLSQINQAGGGVAFEKGGITKFQDGGISAPVMSLSDIGDNGANDITQEVTSQVSPIKVVNVVTDTMEAQNSILNVQSEAEIG